MKELEFTFNKTTLIHYLKLNQQRYIDSREALLKVYEEEVEAYQKEYKKYSQRVVNDELGEDDYPPQEPQVPRDMRKVYKDWLKVLSLCLDDYLTINYRLYEQLVLDRWNWMQDHIQSLSLYSTTTSRSASTLANFAADYSDL